MIINKNKFKYILLILIMLIYILAMSPVSFQNDVFFDIKVGEKYVNEGVSILDDFSIHENLKYVSHHFFVSIITFLVNNYFGFNGIYVLEIILACILALLFYRANKIYIKNKKIAYAFVFLQIFLMNGFISTRAQMYSYLFFLLEFIFIENILRGKGRRNVNILLLTLLPLLIVNFHAGTLPIYFIILFVYLLNYINIKIFRLENEKEYIKNLKYLFIPIVGGLILMFINPFGIDCITYSFKTLGNSFINMYISEFQKTTINNNIMFYILLLAIFFSYFFSKCQVKTHQLCFLIGSAFMSLISLRHLSLFIIMTITNLNIIEEIISYFSVIFYSRSIDVKKQEKVLVTVFLLIIFIFSGYICISKDYQYLPEDQYPLTAVEVLKNNIKEGEKVLNFYDWGSLLMYNNIKPFIDSRCDLYTEEYNEGCQVANDYYALTSCSEDYNRLIQKYDIDYIFIPSKINLYNNLLTNENYEKIYSDEISNIFKVIK